MPDDARIIPVTLELDPETAAALNDPSTRARVERLIRRTVKPTNIERLFEVMDAISVEAERRGLTDEILEAEMEAYNAERRDRPLASCGREASQRAQQKVPRQLQRRVR